MPLMPSNTVLLSMVIELVVILHLNVTPIIHCLDQIQSPAKQMEHGVHQVPHADIMLVNSKCSHI